MGNIKVNTAVLDEQAKQLNILMRQIDAVSREVNSVQQNLQWNVAVNSQIQNNVSSYSNYISKLASKTATLSTTLSSIATQYQKTESDLVKGCSVKQKSITHSTTTETYRPDNSNNNGGLSELYEVMTGTSNLLKYIGQAGTGGGIVSGVLSSFYNFSKWQSQEATGAESLVAVLKNAKTIVNNLYKTYSNGVKLNKLARMWPEQAWKTGIKRFLGLESVSKAVFGGYVSKSSTWGDRFYNYFHRQDGIFDGYTQGGIKGTLKWAGLGLDLVSNGISNYHEMKTGGISAGRAVAETVVETVVDVGKDWIIGTAVTAAIAATTSAAAPVVVVGVATVATSVVLDFACEKITGALTGEEKNLTETFSDFSINTAISIGKGISAARKNISSAVTSWFSGRSSPIAAVT